MTDPKQNPTPTPQNPNNTHPVVFSYFHSVKDRYPREQKTTLAGFRNYFHKAKERDDKEARSKDVPLFCPASFNGTRSKENVVDVYCAVLDFDDGHSWDDFLDHWKGYEFWVYTTFQHTPEHPRWRAVFPFASPVPAAEWESVWEGMSEILGHGVIDKACKDASRMYFMPVCRTGELGSYDCKWFEGALLDPETLKVEIEQETHNREQESAARMRGRVGDEVEDRMSWDEILGGAGWQRAKAKVGGFDAWVKPGAKMSDGHHATTGYRSGVGGERMYNWTDKAGLPVQKLITKFAALVFLQYGGDFKRAAKELAGKGYTNVKVVSTPIDAVEAAPDLTYEELSALTTDTGNAKRFADKFINKVVFVPEFKEWGIYNGKRWEISSGARSKVMLWLTETLEELQSDALLYDDKETRDSLLKWAKSSLSNKSIQAARALAENYLSRSIEDFDNHPWLLNTQTGTVDLRTGKVREHSPGDFFTQITNCGCNMEYTQESISQFMKYILASLPSEDGENLFRVEYLLSWLGYSLSGDQTEQCFTLLYGAGANGKSTITDLVIDILGDYAKIMKTDAIMAQRFGSSDSSGYEIASLKGKRFVIAEESGDGERLNETLIKQLTGTETITARQIYGKPFTYKPQYKLTITGNFKPIIRGQDYGMWRRPRLVHFDQTFDKATRINGLKSLLMKEADSILGLLVSKCLEWQSKRLPDSEYMRKEIADYRDENDFFSTFIEEKCVVETGNRVGCSELHAHYLDWAKRTAAPMMNITQFGRTMGNRPGIERGRDSTGRKVYIGISKAAEYGV